MDQPAPAHLQLVAVLVRSTHDNRSFVPPEIGRIGIAQLALDSPNAAYISSCGAFALSPRGRKPMKHRVLLAVTAATVAAGLYLAMPGASAKPHAATTVPAECVVVNGPNGLTIQVGYAPSGPAGCHQL